MPQTLNLTNFNRNNIVAQSVLSADVAAAVTSLPVQNNAGFIAGPVLLGSIGSESSEIVTITTPSGSTSLPTAATKLAHNVNQPLFMLFGDQIKVYSAADVAGNGTQPPDASFGLVSGTPINITGSNALTVFTDAAGVAGTWYKFTYYNSVTFVETALADAKAVQAGIVHYVSLDQVRRAAGFSNSPNVTDDIVAEFRDAAEKEINGSLLPVYNFPLPQPTNPIIVEIAKNIAAGELKHEMYQNVDSKMASEGEDKASAARHGGGSHTSLAELVDRSVVLEDANYSELTVDEGHGFGGWPDGSTSGTPLAQGGDCGPQFNINEIY